MVRRTRPGISRFRVRCFASPRNDGYTICIRRLLVNVRPRPCRHAERPAIPRRAVQRLAVRAGQGDRGAAEEKAEGRGAVRDRLWTLRPAAYRHFWRGCAHHHGAACLPRADRRQDQDETDRVLRRHGWTAQGAGQCAEQGDAVATSRQAADHGARSVRDASEFRRPQQCAAARLSRHVRIRLRICEFNRLLQVGKVRCDATLDAGAHRPGDGDHAAVVARGARGELFAVPADQPAHRRGAVCADIGARREGRHHLLRRSRDQGTGHAAGHRRALQAAMEAGLGDALGSARRRLRDGRQGPDRTR